MPVVTEFVPQASPACALTSRAIRTQIGGMTPLRIAVLGAGYVGSALATSAASAGHATWAVRRTAVPATGDGVRWCCGDVTTGRIDGLPDALDVVAVTVAWGGSGRYADVYPPAVTHAIALAQRTGARRIVYTSSTGVYGGRDGAWVDESSPRLGEGEGNAALIHAEDLLLEAGLPVHVLRVAGIYGPGRDPRARFRNPASLTQRGATWVNLAHRDDIAQALLLAAQGAVQPAVVNVADGSPVQGADVCRWLVAQAGGDAGGLQFTSDAPPARNDQRVTTALLAGCGFAPAYPSFREGFTRGL